MVASLESLLNLDDYTFLEDAFYGTGGFKDGKYLVPHVRETPEKYIRRQKLAYYLNYIAAVVDSHVNPVFRNEPEREWSTNELFSRFMEDTDTLGTPINRFMKRAGRIAKLHGTAFIVIDNGKDQPGNMADVLKQRALPYAYIVTKKQVITCKTNKVGRMTDFSYTVAAETSFGSVTQTETWIWTETTWRCQAADGTINEGMHNLGCVPVVPLLSRPGDPGKLTPQSEFYSIAQTNLALYNLCSEIRELIRAQAFAILTYPISSDGGQDAEDMKDLVVGPENVLGYDGSLSNKPEYTAPPADQLAQLRAERTDLITEIYRMAEMSHVTGVETKTSGVAKQWDFQQANQVLADFAWNCQDAEIKMATLFELWTNTTVNFSCIYSDDFGIVDVAGALDEVSKALDLNISSEFNGEAKKKAVAVFLNDIPEDRYDAVIADIEARAQDEKYIGDTTQISDLTELLTDVSGGTIAPVAAVIILQAFFGLDETAAAKIIEAQQNAAAPPATDSNAQVMA
jgi:hypothetical protein